jgi:very-short-patch-repair endonuclease
MSRNSRPKNIICGQSITLDKAAIVKQLRREMTPPERFLWRRLRANQLCEYHFRRQQFIVGYIADFYCHQASLVVELDGQTHDLNYDARRDEVFAGLGIKVLRFTNSQVLSDIETVLEQILFVCNEKCERPTP